MGLYLMEDDMAYKGGFKEIVVEGDPQSGWLHVAVRD